MTIGAVLMVKDEIDLLRRNLAYHSSIGVDYFVICDRGSSDETQQELEVMASLDNVHLLRQHLYNLKVEEITTETMKKVRLAALEEMRRVFAPDWLFPADTDEFWVPSCGNLARFVSSLNEEHLAVNRFNALPNQETIKEFLDNPNGSRSLLEFDIIVKRQSLSPESMSANPQIPWIFHAVVPKFLTSATDFREVAPGFHNVHYRHEPRRGTRPDLLILHLPFTTIDRFSNKIANFRRHIAHIGHTFRDKQAWHVKRWVSLADDGKLDDEFEKQFLGPSELESYRRNGVVMSVGSYFGKLASEYIPSTAGGHV